MIGVNVSCEEYNNSACNLFLGHYSVNQRKESVRQSGGGARPGVTASDLPGPSPLCAQFFAMACASANSVSKGSTIKTRSLAACFRSSSCCDTSSHFRSTSALIAARWRIASRLALRIALRVIVVGADSFICLQISNKILFKCFNED